MGLGKLFSDLFCFIHDTILSFYLYTLQSVQYNLNCSGFFFSEKIKIGLGKFCWKTPPPKNQARTTHTIMENYTPNLDIKHSSAFIDADKNNSFFWGNGILIYLSHFDSILRNLRRGTGSRFSPRKFGKCNKLFI